MFKQNFKWGIMGEAIWLGNKGPGIDPCWASRVDGCLLPVFTLSSLCACLCVHISLLIRTPVPLDKGHPKDFILSC